MFLNVSFFFRKDGACNHVAALLETLVNITNQKKDGTLSCTSQKCSWNNPRKRKLSPKKAQDLNFSRKSVLNKKLQLNDEVKPVNIGIEGKDLGIKNTFNVETFKNKRVQVKSNAGWLTYFETEPVQERTVPNLLQVNYMYMDSVDLEDDHIKETFQQVFKNQSVSDLDCANIEKMTRGQNKNKQWFKARTQRITASNFGCIVKRKPSSKPDSVLKDVMGYRTFDNKYCSWGRSHEPAAPRTYANSRRDTKVHTCGLLVNTKFPHLGASPDALLENSNDGQGILEIKCPASDRWKNIHPGACAMDSDFYCSVDDCGMVKLKRSNQYYFQVQGQLAISGRKWCDFMVWTLKGWTVERIYVDNECWNNMLPRLKVFYVKFVLPELFTERIKRGYPLY